MEAQEAREAREARKPWTIYVLIAANVAMFLVELASGASPTSPTSEQIISLGGNLPTLTLNGEWWRLISSMFLHIGILHIALNMLCLYQARVVEQVFGHLGFLALYVVAGLGGGIASLMFGSDHIVTAGASGAVFGVYGAFGAFLVLRRSQIEADAWQRTARSIGGFLVINLAFGIMTPRISMSAHVGGLIVGALGGAALLAGSRAAPQRTPRAIAILVLGVALTAAALLALPAYADVDPLINRFVAMEHAELARWNDAIERRKTGALKDTDLADILEAEILPAYRTWSHDLHATQNVPPQLRAAFSALDAYAASRLTAFTTVDQALRETDPAKQKPLLETFQRQQKDVESRLEAYTAATEALN
ncbi:MAG TPA: rhomboid family intramembrane serine protease [Kofleriaceae bacterium]|jgi:rhomboid protease GluP|nr:rhomboid family intramembrane serine protease [Kofleriaceae bacterium]